MMIEGFQFNDRMEGTTTTTTRSDGCCLTTQTNNNNNNDNTTFEQQNHRNNERRVHNNNNFNPATNRLNEMSSEERQYILEDIHGVADTKKKKEEELSEEYITKHLQLFELSINNVKGTIRIEYDMAFNLNPLYVTNTKFRLYFLRGMEYNIINATNKIMLHFKYKLLLFDKHLLVQNIMFDDLSIDVQGLLYTGVQQFSKHKDIQGRTIMINFPEFNVPSCTWQNFARARWYQYMVALEEDHLTQIHGLVIVSIWTSRSIYSSSNMKALQVLRDSIPLRLKAVHTCFINYNLLSYQLLRMLDMFGKRFLTRWRSHVDDSTIHCLYKLQSFGINPKCIPLEEIDERPHKKWFLKSLEKRKIFERQLQVVQQQQQEQQQQKMYNNNENNKQLKCGINNNNNSNSNNDNNTIITTTTTTRTSCKNRATTTETTTTLSCSSDTASISNGSDINDDDDDSSSTTNGIIIPSNTDVILGRGIKSSGNTILDDIIDLEMISYEKAITNFDKTCITLATVTRIKANGGRFLKKKKKKKKQKKGNNSINSNNNYNNNNYNNDYEWVIVDDEDARKSVCDRIRKRIKRRR